MNCAKNLAASCEVKLIEKTPFLPTSDMIWSAAGLQEGHRLKTLEEAESLLGRAWQVMADECRSILGGELHYESFIAGFSHPDDANAHERGYMKARAQTRQENRRLQRELPERSWADERILMISHSFAVMQFKRNGNGPNLEWKRELLPTVVRMMMDKRRNLFSRGSVEHVLATHRAARTIADNLDGIDTTRLRACDHRYMRSDEYREVILPLIGRALGQFDLVVVDEAHKTRGEDSSLSRILGPVTWESDDPFRLGMTATPVELNADQWLDTIARISGRDDGQDTNGLQDIRAPLDTYVEVVARLRREELDAELVSDFEAAAAGFHAALAPFVLRRDKRDDPVYASFMETFGDYRDVRPLLVDLEQRAASCLMAQSNRSSN